MSFERLSEWIPITSLHSGLCHRASVYFLYHGNLIFKYCHCNPLFDNPTKIRITRLTVEGWSEASHIYIYFHTRFGFKSSNNINVYWRCTRKQQRSLILLCNTNLKSVLRLIASDVSTPCHISIITWKRLLQCVAATSYQDKVSNSTLPRNMWGFCTKSLLTIWHRSFTFKF
jgi:hypothetical protein